MEVWSSRRFGVSETAVHEGFQEQRTLNRSMNIATRGVEKGFETRYLRNRAAFAAYKASEMPEPRRNEFVDRKVWSA